MAEPKEKDMEELSVTVLGDMASGLQIASHQRKSAGEENYDVTGLVEEAVSDWLHKEIYGTAPETPVTAPVTPVPETPEPATLEPEASAPEKATPVNNLVPSVGRRLAPFMVLVIVLAAFIGWGVLRDSATSRIAAAKVVGTGARRGVEELQVREIEGGRDPALLDKARQEVVACLSLEGSPPTPSPRYFSPRFVEFFEPQRADEGEVTSAGS